MTSCPKCKVELQELDLDIVKETEESEALMNAREYQCPSCGAKLQVFIKVDLVEVVDEQLEGEEEE